MHELGAVKTHHYPFRVGSVACRSFMSYESDALMCGFLCGSTEALPGTSDDFLLVFVFYSDFSF